MKPLTLHPTLRAPRGPVVLAILDGVGIAPHREGNAVAMARTPTLDLLLAANAPGGNRLLRAHGTAVGLPSDDDMGNSEVGHNALGAGRVFAQGAKLVNESLRTGALFSGATWQRVVAAGANGTVHFIALLSDGGVHSHIDHLLALLRGAARGGCRRVVVHALLDGRDVPPTSAITYVTRLERVLAELRAQGIDARVGSGGGRMTTTMDRYDADWSMVERGWHVHVQGRGRDFASLEAAVLALRAEQPGVGDQNLPSFIVSGGAPIQDGDAVVLCNFRGDRALELCRAFEADVVPFERGHRPAVFFAGMMEYDGDLHIPKHSLVAPPAIDATMSEYLARAGVSQLAISETQKYGHVTYFWNGNRTGAFDPKLETYVEIPSDTLPFDERPWMKAAEITDRLIAELRTGRHRFARVNYANGDMVGHTGSFDAACLAVAAVDSQLTRLVRCVTELGGVLLVTADHGNADEMYQLDKSGHALRTQGGAPLLKTSHTLARVPFALWDPTGTRRLRAPSETGNASLTNVAATCMGLLGFSAPSDYDPSLLES